VFLGRRKGVTRTTKELGKEHGKENYKEAQELAQKFDGRRGDVTAASRRQSLQKKQPTEGKAVIKNGSDHQKGSNCGGNILGHHTVVKKERSMDDPREIN